MKALKSLLSFLVVAIIVGGIIYFKDDIVNYFIDIRVREYQSHTYVANKYYRVVSNPYVSDTDDFVPTSRQDLLNIFYTALNAGLDEFEFHCSPKYEACLDDVKKFLSEEDDDLTFINSFVHPYNSFEQIDMTVSSVGVVTLKFQHRYTKGDIIESEEYASQIMDSVLNDEMSNRDKIKALHDYIINNTKYDSEKKNKNSHKANGLFKSNLAICGGYADAMAVFLDKLNIPNYEIFSEEHVWNYVYLDGEWLHLDLTWDDPITNTGEDIITYDYFLIDDDTLLKKDSSQHTYEKKVFLKN